VRITTNNYGYYPTEIEAYEKYQLQMYEECAYLLEQENVDHVLEIGCGAGGGIMHMQSCLPNAHFAGLDRCRKAAQTCKYFFGERQKRIKFYNNIDDIFTDGRKFDAIVSVEIGVAINPSILGTIHNLLNDKGVFICYDNVKVNKLPRLNKSIGEYDFQTESFRDITANVLNACKHDTPRRLEIVEKYLPGYLRPFKAELLQYMSVKDSRRYVNYSNGVKQAFLLKARKTNRTQVSN
jgi:cyclopropane fatty-acyl-phospholipid synthase-like methyltransferase